MLPPISFLSNPKKILREKMKGERAAAADARPDAARHAARNFLASIDIPDGAVISLYHPIGDELDTAPLAEELHARGVALALPSVEKRKAPLVFRAYAPGARLEAGAYGVKAPQDAPEARPDIIVAPLLAFTREGGRLGYGGGYYDRTLSAARETRPILAIGYAYGAQEVDALPLSRLDQPLDWVVTEREAIRC